MEFEMIEIATQIMVPDNFKIGTQAKSIRIEKGISQKEMAIRLGLSSTYISHLESGNAKWRKSIFEKYKKVLEGV